MFLPGMKYTWLGEAEPRAVGTFSFGSINQNFDDIVILCLGVRNDTATSSRDVIIEFNGDTTQTNYAVAYILHTGASFPPSTGSINNNIIYQACPVDALLGCDGVIWIPNYNKAGIVKVSQSRGMQPDLPNTATHTSLRYFQFQTQWATTDPITRIDLALVSAANYVAPTKFVLYGLTYGT